MQKKVIILTIIINILLTFYLLLPFPKIPDLKNGVPSPEPGDNGQISNLKAFFTNDYRAVVMPFYYKNISHPYIVVNHPPERAKQIFKDTMQSYFLEEFVIPLKGSIYINGYEWENDVFTKPDKRQSNKMLIGKDEYKSKITIRWFIAPTYQSLLNLFLLNLSIFSIFFGIRKVFYDNK